MRISTRSALIWGLFLALSVPPVLTEPVLADFPDGVESEEGDIFEAGYEDPGAGYLDSGNYGPMPVADEFGYPGGGVPMYQQGPPPMPPDGMQPWPQVSPFMNNFSETRQDHGLWFNETNNRPRIWYAGVSYLRFQLHRPGDVPIGFEVPIGLADIAGNRVYPQQPNLWEIRNDMNTNGVMPFVGFTNPDDTGAEISGFYLQDRHEGVTFPMVQFPARIVTINPVTQQYGEPLQTALYTGVAGTSAASGATGTTGTTTATTSTPINGQLFTYDQGFALTYRQQAFQGQADWFSTPIIGRGTNKVRVSYGLRYLQLNEGMGVLALDTLHGTTTIDSTVKSYIGGPQVGLQWTLGGSNFKFVSYGKLGVFGNWERMDLATENYGGNSFVTRARKTGVSPMLDFGFTAQMPLFGYVPLINKVPVVKDGIFRIGYQWTGFWQMQRPASMINYTVNNPSIDYDPKLWYYRGLQLGIDWKW